MNSVELFLRKYSSTIILSNIWNIFLIPPTNFYSYARPIFPKMRLLFSSKKFIFFKKSYVHALPHSLVPISEIVLHMSQIEIVFLAIALPLYVIFSKP